MSSHKRGSWIHDLRAEVKAEQQRPWAAERAAGMSDERLKGIVESWRLSTDENGAATFVTPPAHVAREQVLELAAEVRSRLDDEGATDFAVTLRDAWLEIARLRAGILELAVSAEASAADSESDHAGCLCDAGPKLRELVKKS